MRLKLMTLRYSSTLGGFDETPLERFVSDKEVLGFKEHFFLVNDIPHLLCVVSWRLLESAATAEGATAPEGRGRRGARPDPCEGLDEGQRRAFESLRAWRLDKAHRDGVPPYVVLTNKELGAIVRAAPDNLTALGHVDGIGKGKLERHGAEILATLAAPSPACESTTGADPGRESAS